MIFTLGEGKEKAWLLPASTLGELETSAFIGRVHWPTRKPA